jgi:hypothetical protein
MSERTGVFWDELRDVNPEAVIFDGPGAKTLFDPCIVGYASRINQSPVLVYDEEKMIVTLCREENMSYNDAVDYLSFNTFGAWVGEGTPLILRAYRGGA